MAGKEEGKQSFGKQLLQGVLSLAIDDASAIIRKIKDENLIDRGSYGEVYGPFTLRKKKCAVKRISFSKSSGPVDMVKKYNDLWVGLSHENLMGIFEVFQNGQILYTFMEYVHGGSVRKTLDMFGPKLLKLPASVVSNWAKQIAGGMSYLHDQNIIHRDLKSSNVLLTKRFDPSDADAKVTLKIADFDEMREHYETVTMTLAGSLGWMAPEVILTEKFSKASDVWSYGVIVWEMLTGDFPHKDIGKTLQGFTQKASLGTLALPLPKSISPTLAQLLSYCFRLEKNDGSSFQYIVDLFDSSTKARYGMKDDYAVIIGVYDGANITDDVLKINLHRPSEMYCLEQIPTEMQNGASAAVHLNAVYVVGIGGWANKIWKYDFISGWQKCTHLIKGRQRHSVAFVDDVLYICGGIADMIGPKKVLETVEAYNTKTNTCTSVGKLVHPIESSGNCVSYQKSVYIFGGSDKNDETSSHVQVFDTTKNTPHLLSKTMPKGDILMQAALCGETVLLLGELNCFIYNFETETWQVREQFKTGVYHFGLAASDNRIFVIGGGTGETDAKGKRTWTCRDDVRSVAIEEFIENKPVEWKIHSNLPKPCLVQALGIYYTANGGVDLTRDVEREVPANANSPHGIYYAANGGVNLKEDVEREVPGNPNSPQAETEDQALIIGFDEGPDITNDVLKINLHRPSEMKNVEKVPTSMRMEAAAAVYHNIAYVVGLGEYANEIWKYEFTTGWHKCAALIQQRRRHSVAFVDEVLFICGGFVDEEEKVLDSVEAYNIITNTCTSVGKLIQPIDSSGNCVSYQKSVYIFGGSDKNDKTSSHVQVFDTITNTSHMQSRPMPKGYILMRAALCGETVLLFGKYNCFIYNFETETWQVRKQFKTDVIHFGLVASNNRIFVIGGGTCETDSKGKDTWTCRDDVRSVAIERIIENKPVEWKIHSKLPKPCLVQVLVKQ